MQASPAMKKPLEIWQAIVATLLLALSATTIIINQSNRITQDEIQIGRLIENKGNTDKQFEEVNANLMRINGKLTEILISLEDKQNRSPK